MKLNKNSLIIRIWKYLIIFSILILLFLWLFQVIFLDKYYEWYKTKSIKKVAEEISDNYSDDDEFFNTLEEISINEGICIELSSDGSNWYYSSNMNKSCLWDKRNPELVKLKEDFMDSDEKTILLKNHSVNNVNSLIYGIKLDNDSYVFLNTILDPIDSTITILKNQLLIVTIIVIILSSIIAYYISNLLSKPITSLNKSAKAVASGKYDVVFPNTNISEINQLSDTLNYAKMELAKTYELRKDLMANVSHDLKTPLTMIKAYAEMVRDITYKNKKKRDENLNVIIEEVDRLNSLVSDILELSSLQSNINELNVEEFDIVELITNIIHRFEIFNLTEQFEFNFINEEDKVIVKADKKKIEQVIYNLISNAVNYSKNEKIVTIKLINNKDNVRIEVIDHGKGIDKEDLKYIWDRYYKVDKKYKRTRVGTGLGLSIVKNILELHKYKYGVLSEKNKGTTFYFEMNK